MLRGRYLRALVPAGGADCGGCRCQRCRGTGGQQCQRPCCLHVHVSASVWRFLLLAEPPAAPPLLRSTSAWFLALVIVPTIVGVLAVGFLWYRRRRWPPAGSPLNGQTEQVLLAAGSGDGTRGAQPRLQPRGNGRDGGADGSGTGVVKGTPLALLRFAKKLAACPIHGAGVR